MKLVTAANKKYEPILNLTTLCCKNLNLDLTVYNLNNELQYGIPFETKNYFGNPGKFTHHGKSPYKADILKDFISNNINEKMIGWIDCDAFPVKTLNELSMDDSFDMAVTLRRPIEKTEMNQEYHMWSGYINAGVMFFRPSFKILSFLDTWNSKISTSRFNSDQHALNQILLKTSELTVGAILHVDGIKIKILDTDTYNWYYWDESINPNAKILHLKQYKKYPEILNRVKEYIT